MDYKELIELSQKAATEWRNNHAFYQAGVLIDSLCTAIETIMAERDAAIAELDRIAEFTENEFLGYLNNTIHHECGYEYYSYLFDLLCQVTHWEYDDKWRGPQTET